MELIGEILVRGVQIIVSLIIIVMFIATIISDTVELYKSIKNKQW